jgi:hypothetical protein
MTTITYHDRYIGESGPVTKFSKSHYVVIATTLKEANADWGIVEAFVKVLEADNERFDADLFRKASHALTYHPVS